MPEEHRQRSLELHRDAPRFIDDLAARIVASGPDLVGFTSTFQQNIPVLAVAKAIKALAPSTLIAMGGANCDGEQGDSGGRGECPRFLEDPYDGGLPGVQVV